MKRIKLSNSGLSSLVALISVLSAFAATVLLCLFVLSNSGIVPEIPIFKKVETTGRVGITITEPYTEINKVFVSPSEDKDEISDFLVKLPYINDYHAEYYIRYSVLYETTAQLSEKRYEIYKNGENYKIIYKDSDGNAEYTLICISGKMYVMDSKNTTVSEYVYTEAYAFEKRIGLPGFEMLSSDDYELAQAYISGDEYVIFGSHDNLGVSNEYHISTENGSVKTIYSSLEGNTFCICSQIYFEAEYEFSDTDFVLPG